MGVYWTSYNTQWFGISLGKGALYFLIGEDGRECRGEVSF